MSKHKRLGAGSAATCSKSKMTRTVRGVIGAVVGGAIAGGGELILGYILQQAHMSSGGTFMPTADFTSVPTTWFAISAFGGAAAGAAVGAYKPDC